MYIIQELLSDSAHYGIQCCHCCGSVRLCGTSSIPGSGISVCRRQAQPKYTHTHTHTHTHTLFIRFQEGHRIVQLSSQANFRTFSLTQKRNPIPISLHSSSPPPTSRSTFLFLWVCQFQTFHIESYYTLSFVSNFFHLIFQRFIPVVQNI